MSDCNEPTYEEVDMPVVNPYMVIVNDSSAANSRVKGEASTSSAKKGCKTVLLPVLMIVLMLGAVSACVAFALEISALKSQAPPARGANYIRWGRTTCPDTEGTQLLYKGVAAGPHFTAQGGGSNYLCLPDEPEFLNVTVGNTIAQSQLYGAEYEANPVDLPPAFGNLHDHNVPCATCYTSTRGDKIMIPGKVNCPPSWTREYYGYLMSESSVTPEHHRMSYECVDKDAEAAPGSVNDNDTNGTLFYFTEVSEFCYGLKCPPYVAGHELTCVVCTK